MIFFRAALVAITLSACGLVAEPSPQIRLSTAGPHATTRAPTPGSGAGVVVFTFDDGFRSQLDAAMVLEAHGYRGTFYISAGQLRSTYSYASYVSESEIRSLARRGHDVQSHTVSHANLPTLPDAGVEEELRGAKAIIERLSGRPAGHLAYPYGAYDDRVAAIVRRFYRTGRGSSEDHPRFWPEVLESKDHLRLPALVVTAATTLPQIQRYVDLALSDDGRLILVFHGLHSDPAGFDWGPEQFAALVEYVARRDARVRTMSELFGSGAP